MTNKSLKPSEDIREILANRIEIVERILLDDEEFCRREIESTYDAAKVYFNKLQKQIEHKLNQLKTKLDLIQQENSQLCKKNQKQFDNELETVNELFSSGKHIEGLFVFLLLLRNNSFFYCLTFSIREVCNL